ncbi:MAG: hypothetical protein E7460_02820 [Ruminococcaceae bacterium]|nr:hypothetical protein [Oscillospiraceae bacterium]
MHVEPCSIMISYFHVYCKHFLHWVIILKKICIIALILSIGVIFSTVPDALFRETDLTYSQNADPHRSEPYFLTGTGENRLDINKMTPEVLRLIPGIGSHADGIIALREELGGFDSLEQLTFVSGVGIKSLQEAMDYITIG